MNTSKPTAYSYVRFSSAEQAKGASLARQLELAEAYAKEHDLILDDSLSFKDLGVSAYKKHNIEQGGDLKRFLDAVDDGLILPGSYLLVESLDRISRTTILAAVEILLGILRRKIIIVTLNDGMVFRPEEVHKHFTPLIMAVVTFQRANEESETKSKRLCDVWERKRNALQNNDGKSSMNSARRLSGVCPAWLSLSADATSFEFIPEKRAVVEDIVQMIMSGFGKRAIAKHLNEKGTPTISLATARRSKAGEIVGAVNPDRIWQESYITKIIKNRALIGEYQPYKTVDGKRAPAGDPLRDYFPRLVSDEEFALLQDVLSERGSKSGGRRGRTFSNLFTGLVKCGYCGSSMVFIDKGVDKRGKRDNSKNRFLVCGKAKRGPSNSCHYVTWTYSEFENAFFRCASRSDFSRFITDSNDRGAEIRALNNQLIVDRAQQQQLDVEKQRCMDAIKGATRMPQAVLDELLRIEDDQAERKVRIEMAEVAIKSARVKEYESEAAIESLRRIFDELQSKSGDEAYAFRARLNEHMRRIMQFINLYPGGTIETQEKIDFLRKELMETGRYPQEDIAACMKMTMRTKPDKAHRYFTIKNRDMALQVLFPEEDIPNPFDALKYRLEIAAHIHKKVQEEIILERLEKENDQSS